MTTLPMTRFFTPTEAADFRSLGWDTCGSSAYFHSETLGIGIQCEADGDLFIQQRGDDGKWRWVVKV